MKYLASIILSLLLCQFTSYAQGDLSYKSIRIGFSVSPDYNYRKLVASDLYSNYSEFRDSTENAKIGYTAGLRFIFSLTKRFSLETGLLYSDRGQISNIPFVDSGTTVGNIKQIHHVNYLDVPLKMNIAFIAKKRIHLFISAGASANFFLFENIDYVSDYFTGEVQRGSYRSNNNNLNKVGLTALGGLGIDLFLTKRFSVRAEPIFRYAVIPNMDTNIKQYPYSFGANFGLYVKL